MPSYVIDYLWTYNPHGEDGGRYADQEIPLTVRYHVQPDEPDIGVKFDITVEEITDANGGQYCTDAAFECGWYKSDQEHLENWLWDGAYAEGKPARASVSGDQ